MALGLTDRAGVIVRVNAALCRLLGYAAEDVVGTDETPPR